jgi:methylmalonyl-CoA mutase N-terminal domain/subunit
VFSQRLSFFFNAHNHIFEEVAKFRAARRIWANITKSLGATDPRAQMLRFHTQTGGSTLTALQPKNNIVRVTLQGLSAVLGGTQSLHTNGYDEALSLPTEEAAAIALRTQQIIAYESGVTDTPDPLAGSYFVESLTNEVEAAALQLMDKIDAMGGSIKAIESRFMQDEIARSAYAYNKAIENKTKVIVGVNKFATTEANDTPLLKIDDTIRKIQSEKLQTLRNERDNAKVAQCLERIKTTAATTENLMPAVIDAVENLCTLGEISDTLRAIWGEYRG